MKNVVRSKSRGLIHVMIHTQGLNFEIVIAKKKLSVWLQPHLILSVSLELISLFFHVLHIKTKNRWISKQACTAEDFLGSLKVHDVK